MIKFPYAISDFYLISTDGYFYVDRTDRIFFIEDAGNQLLFLRPRRFGKSMLLSMLETFPSLMAWLPVNKAWVRVDPPLSTDSFAV